MTAWIDLTGLRPAASRQDAEAVLNGIAYDEARDRLFVTGKQWPASVRDRCASAADRGSRHGGPMTGGVTTIRAHAKINLDLRVLGARADGFHELRTVFQSIALHDTITCTARPGPFAIECDTAGVPLDRTNLVWRAAEALWRALRRAGPLRDVLVRVEKQIPVEAGLGGGSADAAATLLALARAWRVPVRPAQLTDLAAMLGADVPFFLSGGTALGLGRGDEVYPLADLPRHWVVLLLPGFGVSTRDAFAWYAEERALGRSGAREPQYVPGHGRRARRR